MAATPDPRNSPISLEAPDKTPSRDRQEEERSRRAPGGAEQPDVDAAAAGAGEDLPGEAARLAEAGAVHVDAVEAHMGATEEQIGDLTGPGAGYDEHRKR